MGKPSGPSRDPQVISKTDWYYEGRKFFIFIHEVRDEHGNHIRTDQFQVPLALLRKSVERVMGGS